ncbi:MAG: hypothetical protein ACOX6T_03430 [Myxococcales bacterium]|jgi:hypothetical protein
MATKPNFKDRLIWTLASAAAVAVAATLAQNAVGYLWARTTHRPVPKPLPFLRPAGSRAGKGAAGFLMKRAPILRALRG